jgi:adenylate cyclase
MRKALSYIIPALILLGVVVFHFSFPEPIESFRAKVFDIFQMIKPRVYQDTPVRIIDIDDESLEKIGQWPWPRTVLGKLIVRLVEGGATVIAFDGVFAEPDRTSPKNILPIWTGDNVSELLRAQLEMIPDHDDVFAKVIAHSPVVLAFGLTREPNAKIPLSKSGISHVGEGEDKPIDHISPAYKGSVLNLPVLEKASKGNGCFDIDEEWDNIVRKVPSFYRLNNSLFPSLAMETMRVYQDASTYIIALAGSRGEKYHGERSGIVKVKVGLLEVPTDSKGRVWLYDTGPRFERYIPAWKVLSDDKILATLKDKILFIGSSALALRDIRSTPLNSLAAGVDVHAQISEQMLLGNFLNRPDWAVGAEFFFLFVMGLLLILILPRMGAVLCALIGMLAIASAFGLSWYQFVREQNLIDPVFPSLGILLIFLVTSFFNFLGTERERSQVRGAFGRYLSPVLVEKLAKNPKQLKLGGEIRVMSFLFTDIRNFTGIAEQMKPEELTHFMNKFLTPMTDIVLKHAGTIDKYIGDCIMAFWNAPMEDKEHSRHACLAALDMQVLVKEWNMGSEKGSHPLPFVKIGIGINSGQACVGNMGSEQRFDYTVLGDHVNLASRLESLSKNYGMTTVVGQNTVAEVPELAFLEIDMIRVKGKTKPVRIFTLLGDAGLANQTLFREVRENFEKMLTAYRAQRWDDAERYLENCRHTTLSGIDLGVLYELYVSRILAYRINPPPSQWDGTTTADSK